MTAGFPLPHFVGGQVVVQSWNGILVLASLTMSLVVNALATSLVVFRIFKVFREVRPTSDEQILGAG